MALVKVTSPPAVSRVEERLRAPEAICAKLASTSYTVPMVPEATAVLLP